MTVEQLRVALAHMNKNYHLAVEACDYTLAAAFKSKIDFIITQLHEALNAEDDPYTTLADHLYYESQGA